MTDDELRARVGAYCERYGVAVTEDGQLLPPFPSGRRETAQHREWLTVYRAVRRFQARAGAVPDARTAPDASTACRVCGRPVSSGSTRELKLGAPGARVRVHGICADLAERARAAGPDAVERLVAVLWPSRATG